MHANPLKQWLSRVECLYRFYHWHLTGRLRKNAKELIRRSFRWQASVFFVQIGSNDGRTGDPVYSLVRKFPKYRGLFVEPVPYLFERLRENYTFRDNLLFENSAVNAGISQKFYWIDPSVKEHHPDLPPWFDQLGSFKEDHLNGLTGLSDILLPYRRETEIKGVTFPDLLEKHRIVDFDLLHIDTEGYDYQVLRQVDFERHRPKVVLYEHKCLTSEEKLAAEKHLEKWYNLKDIGPDMFCTRK